MKVLMDTVILIDHFNGLESATAYLHQIKEDAICSVITRAEVLAGFDGEEFQKAQAFLDCFPTYPVTRVEADEAARLRKKHRWKLPDALQAAISLRFGFRLATRNTKDFNPEIHSFVIVPYRI